MKAKFRSVFISWDMGLACIVLVSALLFLPNDLDVKLAKNLFEVIITVLTVIFSVFFAAMAILVTAGDNEFVRFLEEEGTYTRIMWTFKFTLLVLFVSLIVSLILFMSVLPYQEAAPPFVFPKYLMAAFAFMASYALFATAICSLDAIKYAEFRARFLKVTKNKGDS
jgi:hypothetical protein